MLTITDSDSGKLKEIFKQAIIEAIEEKKDVVHDLLMDAMEDLAMIHAIQEGEKTGSASRNEVFDILEGKA
jgi:spore coat polysaccharide biosynthesis protein SpsF (cytidylyltransferase family)